MFPLLETVRVDNDIPLLAHLHVKRMENSIKILYGKKNPDFNPHNCLDSLKTDNKGIFKANILYNDKEWQAKLFPYNIREINSLKLVEANVIDYSLKYADRNELNKIFEQREDCDDVLITKNGYITDTSFSNVAFYNGKQWFTPSTPLLNGIMRQHLIKNGVLKEKNIRIKDLKHYKKVVLINAMLDLDEKRAFSVDNIT